MLDSCLNPFVKVAANVGVTGVEDPQIQEEEVYGCTRFLEGGALAHDVTFLSNLENLLHVEDNILGPIVCAETVVGVWTDALLKLSLKKVSAEVDLWTSLSVEVPERNVVAALGAGLASVAAVTVLVSLLGKRCP